MNFCDEQLLKKNDWVVECESPFEIRHTETGSFASGIAVEMVLQNLKSKANKKTKCHCGKPIDYSNSDCVAFSLCKDCSMDA